ncbi:MAG: heavy-metal-associated domain-containing protein [Bacteroidales bacterium]|nr:heavy-metal-associated domain-containing protein [Bacteroidales bacterium]
MLRLLFVLTAGVLMFSCSSNPKTEAADATETHTANAEWIEVVLDVEGMTCDGCENAIKAGVESLDGIAAVESSHEEAWTRVKFDQRVTSLEEIQDKITETGYVVQGEKEEVAL